MAYDGSSPVGDLMCELYDEENNIMNPENDTGWFLYNNKGKTFDYLYNLIDIIIHDFDPITCKDNYLDMIAKGLKIEKNPNWSNDEYRAYLILNTYNVTTHAGLEYVLNQIILDSSNDVDMKVKIGYERSGFRISDESNEYELTSDEKTQHDILEDTTSNIIQITIPKGVKKELIEFIINYLPYEVNLT